MLRAFHCGCAGVPLYQAFLCQTFCQQRQPPYERYSLRQSGRKKQTGVKGAGNGRYYDKGDIGRWWLCRGYAEIYDRNIWYRHCTCRVCGHVVVLRLASCPAFHAVSAGILSACRKNEDHCTADRCGIQGTVRCVKFGNLRQGRKCHYLQGVWLWTAA